MKSVEIHTFQWNSLLGSWQVATVIKDGLEALRSINYADGTPTRAGCFAPAAPGECREPATELGQRLACLLTAYIQGERVDFSDIPLDLEEGVSSLTQRIIPILQNIPYGETRTYAWAAGQLGIPKAARAAGGALGRNPIPLVAPCHRIISTQGKLGGFMHGHPRGLEVKAFLLNLEGHAF